MFYGDQRDETRQFFITVWDKMQANAPLIPLEAQIADVLQLHPEYDSLFSKGKDSLDTDFSIEKGQSNPFLHMGMHLALREQLSTNRPLGLQAIYETYCNNLGDKHTAEHQIIETLGEILWEAQRNGTAPNEQRYLQLLRERTPNQFKK